MKVVLLCSDTTDGRICADEIAGLIVEHLEIPADVVVIEGLNVLSGENFRRIGIQRLVQEVRRIHQGEHPVVLNATAGFKAVVPYLTMYGLLYRISVIYIFERSDTLIVLPPAPVSFDHERLLRARPALLELSREGALSKDRFFANILDLEHAERDWLESLIEEDGDWVTVSAFGSLVLPSVTAPGAQVFLSPQGAKALEKTDGVPYGQFVHMLNRVGDLLWRQAKIHAMPGELKVFKPGRTDERIGAIVKGDKVYVAELWQQHEHEAAAAACREADYDLSRFVKWDDYASQRNIEDVPERPAESEIERLTAENRALRIQLQTLHTKQGQAAARVREEASLRNAQQKQRRRKKKRRSPEPPKQGPMAEKLAPLRTPPKAPDK